ncbi:MAG TPA: hypothetical protein VF173_24060, partial [Thermoanaerobaculia bacterium]|nr:hypothetical protein [Thermoanaerobaculia bacterium]
HAHLGNREEVRRGLSWFETCWSSPAVPIIRRPIVMIQLRTVLFSLLLASPFASAVADEYTDTIQSFRSAEKDANLLDSAYGYAVFPTIGKGAVVLGAAHDSGPAWLAMPSLYGSSIRSTSPVYPGALSTSIPQSTMNSRAPIVVWER